LAIGTDRLFVKTALELGLSVEVIIPCSHYEDIYDSTEVREEYHYLLSRCQQVYELPFEECSEEAYLAAGHWIVDHSDLMILVWNGYPARGKGGTAGIANYARLVRCPFIHINPRLHIVNRYGSFAGSARIPRLSVKREFFVEKQTVYQGEVLTVSDGLPDGWLRYALPSNEFNMARWSVHPVWFALQGAFCINVAEVIDTATGEISSLPASSTGLVIRERIQQVNILRQVRQISGCTSTLSAWLGGKCNAQLAYAKVGLADAWDIDPVPIPEQIYVYHAVLHWLHDQMPHFVLAALRVNPERPELLWRKYTTKFADDVLKKRVLYGLQTADASSLHQSIVFL
jgi:hypothetical protein